MYSDEICEIHGVHSLCVPHWYHKLCPVHRKAKRRIRSKLEVILKGCVRTFSLLAEAQLQEEIQGQSRGVAADWSMQVGI